VSAIASPSRFVSAEEYLAGEELAAQKHEYLNGMVYAMAGGSLGHSSLAVNITGTLNSRLQGKRCRVFNSDVLVRVEHAGDLRFYYPDASIYCGPVARDNRLIEEPSVLFEVLSESTARIDQGEKRTAYFTIPTLEAYVVVDSERREVTVWRRDGDRWNVQVSTAPETRLVFVSADCELTIREIYEGTGL
jgi:Uma2 family endonuclease